MSETTKHNPNRRTRVTRRGKVAAGLGGVGLAVVAVVGINAVDHDSPRDSASLIQNTQDKTENNERIYASQNTRVVRVKPGEGVDAVVQRVYGIDAPDGTNQVVQNNPEYKAEYKAIVEANGGSEELHPGKLEQPVPVDFYTQAEVDQMQAANVDFDNLPTLSDQ